MMAPYDAWQRSRLLLGYWHLLVALIFLATVIRGEGGALVHTLLHGTLFILARRAPSHGSFRTSVSLGSIAWLLRVLGCLKFALGWETLPPVAAAAARNGSLYLGDLMVTLIESAYLPLILPAPVPSLLMCLHLAAYFGAVRCGGHLPRLPSILLWSLFMETARHTLAMYLRRASGQPGSCNAPLQLTAPQLQPQLQKEGTELGIGAEVAAADCSEEKHSWLPAGANVDADDSADSQQMNAELEGHRMEYIPNTPAAVPLNTVAGTPQAIAQGLTLHKSLTSLMLRQHKAGSLPVYRSRLPTTQVSIKLKNTEPDQLASEIIAGISRVLNNQGRVRYQVVRAGVRKGCSLLVADLMHCGPDGPLNGSGAAPSLSHILRDGNTLQALLGALLPPGAPPPAEGSVAHVCCEGQGVDLVWRQGTWAVASPAFEASTISLSLLHVQHAVTRLPGAGPATRKPEQEGSESLMRAVAAHQPRGRGHSVTLLLRSHGLPASLSFTGSDSWGAADRSPRGGDESPGPDTDTSPGRPLVLCVARGPWGSFLPVSVAAVEAVEEEAGLLSSTSSLDGSPAAAVTPRGPGRSQGLLDTAMRPSLIAVTLDVDLATAPHAGVVQLELWQGHTLLVSAPLLLLPPDPPVEPDSNTPAATDPLMDEVAQCLTQYTWDQEQSGHGPSSGNAAWLYDLGQVLHAAAVRPLLPDTPTAQSHSEGPGSWGGIAASTARRYATDPTLTASTLSIAEGLLEFAQQEGLVHVSDLIKSCRITLHSKLSELNNAGAAVQEQTLQHTQRAEAPAGVQQEQSASTERRRVHTGDAEGSSGKRQKSQQSFDGGRNVADLKGSKWLLEDMGSASSGKPHTPKHLNDQPQQQGQSQDQNQPPRGLHLPSMPLQAAGRGVLQGFHPYPCESQYGEYLASRTSSLVSTMSIIFLLQQVISALRDAVGPGGLRAVVSNLPTQLLYSSPHVLLVVVASRKQYRWQESALVATSVVVAGASILCARGLLTWPTAFAAGYKYKMDIWADVIMYAPARPLRLAALLLSSVFYLINYTAICYIHEHNGGVCLRRTILPRLGTLLVGLGVDLYWRLRFLQARRASTHTQ